MLGKLLILPDVPPGDKRFGKVGHFLLEAGGQHCKPHDLDEADVFLFDVVQLLMRVEYAQRVFRGGDVIAQHQVKLIELLPAAGDGGDGIVRLAPRFGKDEGVGIGVAPPCRQDAVGQLRQPVRADAPDADDRKRPFDDARLDILKAGEDDRLLDGGLFHGEGITPALKMIVREDGAAHNGEIGIAAHKIVRELPDEIQQPAKGRPVDLHGGVGAVEDDAMLVIVDVGAVLEKPVLAVEGDGDDPVVLPGGVIEPARIAFILAAEGAAGIAALRGRLCRGDGPRVLFRLGKIDGDVQLPVGGGGLPFDIPRDAVPADVVGIHREAIEPVGGGLRGGLVPRPEFGNDLRRAGRQPPHQFGIEKLSFGLTLLDEVMRRRIIRKLLQNFRKGTFSAGGFLPGLQSQCGKQAVDRPNLILRRNEPGIQRIADEIRDSLIDHSLFSLSQADAARRTDGQHVAAALAQNGLRLFFEMV